MLPPNTVLNRRYTIVRQLGQGGMGAVYLATDQTFGSTVALKETLIADDSLRRAFEREARLLNSLHHAALPHVFDYFFEGEGQFLVMQYIPGEDLGDQLKRNQRAFPADIALRWADQLLDLLDYLHSYEPPIVHRDIKPENLKLTQRGDIILLDFGLAKGSVDRMTNVSTQSLFGYTPHYAPFEQIRGTGTDPRSDLYALAATIFHLLSGTLPPDALSRAEAIMNGEADPLGHLPSLLPIVSPQVASVLGVALSNRKENRYPSASAMREALRMAMRAPAPPVSSWPVQPVKGDTAPMDSNPHPSLPPTTSTVPPDNRGSKLWVGAALAALFVVAAMVVAAVILVPRLRKDGENANASNTNIAANTNSSIARQPIEKRLVPLGDVSARAGVLGVALDDDGKMLATTDASKAVGLWDATTGASIRSLGDTESPSRCVAASKGFIAAGYDSGDVKVWKMSEGMPARSIHAHDDFVFLVMFNADGTRVATAGGDRVVKIWDTSSGAQIDSITAPGDSLIVSISPDLKLVAYFDNAKGVSIWSIGEKRKLNALAGHAYELRSGAFSPDGKTLALGSTDGIVRFWSIADGKLIRELRSGGPSATEVVWSSDAQLFATGASDGTVALWRAEDGVQLQSSKAHAGGVSSLSFSRDASVLASGGEDKKVHLWSIVDKS